MLPAMNESPKASRDEGRHRVSGPEQPEPQPSEPRSDTDEPSPEEEGYGYGV
jgi:hypothetical protein